MNSQEAKRILAAYRPGSSDTDDPQVAAALEQVARDPALKDWFERQVAFHNAMRESFNQIPVPADLPTRLCKPSKITILETWAQRPIVWAAAAGIILLITFSALWWPRSSADSFAIFETRMVQAALRQYRMDLVTNDMAQIRQFLGRSRAPADYELRGTLAELNPVGAGLLTWKDQRVSMVCLDSGERDRTNVLYLFIVDHSAVTRPPPAIPVFRKVNKLMTACWTQGQKAYLLAAPLGIEELRRYLSPALAP